MKKVLELDEYRVKLLADRVGFDLIEAVVLLDAYLGIGAPGETKAHTARLVFCETACSCHQPWMCHQRSI